MTRARLKALLWLSLCGTIPALWGFALLTASPSDFKSVYYGARCLLQRGDPYKTGEPLRLYVEDGGVRPPTSSPLFQIMTRQTYLPTGFLLVAPLTFLPWGVAHLLWMILSEASLIFAAFLVWDLTSIYAPRISLFLICILLANSEILFSSGNPAGITVSLCIVAVWCFLKNRFVTAGILCLVLSLLIKPHDSGVVWLYFLLVGGIYRKRALQTLALTIVLSLPAFLWVTRIAPHWMQELHSNIVVYEAPGGLDDPRPDAFMSHGPAMVIDMQGAVSVFQRDPRIYNPVSYLISGTLLLVWSITTLRSRITPAQSWLALATVAALTMLITYHRPYDAKLLLLTLPACAMFWSEGRPIRWLALVLTTLGIWFTSDIPLTLHIMLTESQSLSPVSLPAKIMTVLLIRPVPFILFLLSIFYLWAYMRSVQTSTKVTAPVTVA
ncbi:MAG: glycosyltransferase family 87 protein [Terracidiphilus sp.]